MIDKYDETLEVVFSGYMKKYTTVFNQIKRSNYGKRCDAFKSFLEYEGELCYIPTGNACFGRCLEHIYTKYFLNEYKEVFLSSDRRKNIISSATIQPFCREKNPNLCIYNHKNQSILPKTITE